MIQIALAQSDEQIKNCYSVIKHLRNIDQAEFLHKVMQQYKEGYQLVYLQTQTPVALVAVAGFRIGHSLAWGKYLYIDDLITTPESRSKGYGKALLDWLKKYAQQLDCEQLHLDSGVQRLQAHRFYQREQMIKTSFHYAMKL